MNRRLLGRTGLRVSPFCLGAMNFGSRTNEADAIHIVHKAMEFGINFVNTADMDYSGKSEIIVGKAVNQCKNRDKIIWSTEISGPDMGVPIEPNLSRKYIIDACERSLKRFRTDYIDLYNIPRPNPNIPIDEPLRALTDLIRQGKVRYIGTSTFPAWMVMEAISTSEKFDLSPIVAEESPYNLLDRRIENELIPMAIRYNIAIIPWAPLGQGVLAGRYTDINNLPNDSRAVQIGKVYRERVNDKGVEIGRKVIELARESNKTPAQFSYLWVRDQPGVTAPIIGIRTISQLEDIIQAMDMTLMPEELASCDILNPPGSAVTSFFNTAPWMKMRL